MTKNEILEYFKDINFVYNDSTKHDTLSNMLDEVTKEQEFKPLYDPTALTYSCGYCGYYFGMMPYRYCPKCGKKVKYD